MTLPPPGPLDIDVAVADTDPLWRVRFDNALEPLTAAQFERVDHAATALPEGRPAVLLVGPGLADAAVLELADVYRRRPHVLPVLVVAEVSVPFMQQALRAGAYDVLAADTPVDEIVASVRAELAEARRDPLQQQADGTVRPPGRLVVVTSAKSGEGASAVAVNLAAVHASRGRSVALLDGDARFGDLSLLLGLPPAELGAGDGLAEIAVGRQQVTERLVTHEPTGVQVLIPPRSTVPIGEETEDHAIEIISVLQACTDVVVVDAPFRLVEVADLLAYADDVILVTEPDIVSIKNAMIARQVLDRAGRHELLLVLNRYDSGRDHKTSEVERVVGTKVAAALPNSPALRQSLHDGRVLAADVPDDPWVVALSDLAERST